jgi:hypothetical protein
MRKAPGKNIKISKSTVQHGSAQDTVPEFIDPVFAKQAQNARFQS